MSTDLAHRNGHAEIVPARLSAADVVRNAMEELKAIRTFVAHELKPGLDFGVIPGTGDKKTLWLPGAQKVAMYFNTSPEFAVQASELKDGHVEYMVTTRLFSRAGGNVVGSGVGSCSTMEKKYRYRGGSRACPQCGASSIMRSKYGDGFYCNTKTGGCGGKFAPNDPAIVEQPEGRAENPDIYDLRNTVLKMAKKRSLVDAAMGLGCLSELFTQDIGDTFDLDGDEAPAPPPTRPQAQGGSRSREVLDDVRNRQGGRQRQEHDRGYEPGSNG